MQMRDRKGLDTTYLGGPFDRQVRIDDWTSTMPLERLTLSSRETKP
jgi:hypothetical protein